MKIYLCFKMLDFTRGGVSFAAIESIEKADHSERVRWAKESGVFLGEQEVEIDDELYKAAYNIAAKKQKAERQAKIEKLKAELAKLEGVSNDA